MKKLFLFSALALVVIFSARALSLDPQVEEVKLESIISDPDMEADFGCVWCIRQNGNLYCGEGETCAEARKNARGGAQQ